MAKSYSVILVGSGPTSMMAALKLVDSGLNDVLILEKGAHRDKFSSDINLSEGKGGASPFSDAKLNLTHKVGGTLHEVIGLDRFYSYLEEQDSLWLRFKPTDEQKAIRKQTNPNADVENRLFTPSENAIKLRAEALTYNLENVLYTTRHLGTDGMRDIVDNIFAYLEKNGVTIKVDYEVHTVRKENDLFIVNDEFYAQYVLIAAGRAGGHFFSKVMRSFGIPLTTNGIDIGVRVETDDSVFKKFAEQNIYEPKFLARSPSSDSQVRTFCTCYAGFVAVEEYRDTGISLVNGHSYADKKSDNTNFAILVTSNFTTPFNDPHAYAESIARQVNLLAGGGTLVSRYGDLIRGRRTTEKRLMEGAVVPTLKTAVPGNIAFAIPHMQLQSILEFLRMLDNIAPGVASDFTLLHAPEVKYYAQKVAITTDSEVQGLSNLYVGGDNSGYTRGLQSSAIQGLVVADSILKKVREI